MSLPRTIVGLFLMWTKRTVIATPMVTPVTTAKQLKILLKGILIRTAWVMNVMMIWMGMVRFSLSILQANSCDSLIVLLLLCISAWDVVQWL